MSAPTAAASPPIHDDALTACAISLISAILCNVLHEGLGHGAVDLLTGAQSGVISTVAWSSATNSRLVPAGGPLVNLVLGIVLWIALRAATRASMQLRYFLLTGMAFNLFACTGYFLFSGVTNFGDWAAVIAPMHPHWLWRTLLVVGGIASYYGAVLVVGIALVKYLGVPLSEPRRLTKLLYIPYFSAIFLLSAGGLMNPLERMSFFEAGLPGVVGGNVGLLWLRYYIPRKTAPERETAAIARSFVWIAVAAAMSLVFVFVLGRGITLRR
jgi:hypothetical protein